MRVKLWGWVGVFCGVLIIACFSFNCVGIFCNFVDVCPCILKYCKQKYQDTFPQKWLTSPKVAHYGEFEEIEIILEIYWLTPFYDRDKNFCSIFWYISTSTHNTVQKIFDFSPLTAMLSFINGPIAHKVKNRSQYRTFNLHGARNLYRCNCPYGFLGSIANGKHILCASYLIRH